MKIDGETLYGWWEENWPKDIRRGTWNHISKEGQAGWNALAERIKAEMGRPRKSEQVYTIPYISSFPVQRVPGALRDKVYDASKEWWLTRLGFAEPADEAEAEKIKALSKKTYEDAIKNTLVASASTDNEYSTHHKSCALRHDGIACTCP